MLLPENHILVILIIVILLIIVMLVILIILVLLIIVIFVKLIILVILVTLIILVILIINVILMSLVLLTFQGEGLVEAPGGILQLGVLLGGQLWRAGGQQVGVGVGLDGGCGWIVGVSHARLRWQKRATRLGAGDGDPPLVSTMVGGRGSQWLRGVAVEEQLVLHCDWLLASLRLLPLQLLLLPPDVVQQELAVPHLSGSFPFSVPPPSCLT